MGRQWGFHSGKLTCYDLTVTNDISIQGDMTFGDASTDTLTVTGKLDANGNVDLGSGDDTVNIGSGSGDTVNIKEASTISGAVTLDGADSANTITWSGTNTGATPALKFPDDTYIADANGAIGAAAGFVVVDIAGTNYKLQTYAMS